MVVVSLLLLATAGHAQPQSPSTEDLSFDEMVDASDEIVVGRVESSEAKWEGRLIVTTAEVVVEEALKGQPGSRVEIRQMGGTALHPALGSRITMTTSGVSLLQTGEEVFLFIHESKPGQRQLVGGSRGKLRLRRDPATGDASVPVGPKKLRVESTDGLHEISPEAMSLDDLRSRVARRLELRATQDEQYEQYEQAAPKARRQPVDPSAGDGGSER